MSGFWHSDHPRKSEYRQLKDPSNDASMVSFRDSEGRPDTSRGGLLGGKSLGFFSSLVIVVNNIAGPGMLVLPKVYQDAGWFVPTVVLLVVCVASSLAAILLTDAMARVPGNSRFQRRIEFVNVFEEFWGHRGMQLAQGMFIVNMMAQISSSIISNAQVMDSFIVFLNPKHTTYALQVWPTLDFISWSPPLKALLQPPATMEEAAACHQGRVIPFNDPEESRAIISLGYVSLALILIPMSIMNLEENIFIQKISFYMLLLLSGEFLMQFYLQGMGNHEVPAFGGDYSHVLGSIVFNFAFIVVVPSWVNEKRPEVGVSSSIWISTFFSTILYIATGWMGAMAYYRAEGNFLNTLSNACSPTITRVSAFLFAFGMIGLGIPFICIVTRYSLLVGRVCGPIMSHFWAIFFPWLVSWVFYEGGLFNELIAWSGDLALGPINFVFPLLIALAAVGVRGMVPASWLPPHQVELLSSELGGRQEEEEEVSCLLQALKVADPEDAHDKVNMETVVQPLPHALQKYYRPIATFFAVLLSVLIVFSIASHSH